MYLDVGKICEIYPLVPSATFLKLLKTSENHKVKRKGALGTNVLIHEHELIA